MARPWNLVDVPPTGPLSRHVVLRSQILPARHRFPVHAHAWSQFVYATSGTLMVTLEKAQYVITPEQAIWIPTRMAHTTGALDDVEFRNLYIDDAANLQMPDGCHVFSVSRLLRALIEEIDETERHGGEREYRDRLDGLVLDQIVRLKRLSFYLPWPQTESLREVCEYLYRHPDDRRNVDEWAATAGMSARTLTRHFIAETGVALGSWRQKLRVFRSMEWISARRRITDVALELGFASTSAFIFAFRREIGCSPTEWLRNGRKA